MPPTVRFTRDAVLHAACQLMRREGMEALNARAIAKELGGSTQPIFRLFTNMEDLHRELILYVARQFQAHALYSALHDVSALRPRRAGAVQAAVHARPRQRGTVQRPDEF